MLLPGLLPWLAKLPFLHSPGSPTTHRWYHPQRTGPFCSNQSTRKCLHRHNHSQSDRGNSSAETPSCQVCLELTSLVYTLGSNEACLKQDGGCGLTLKVVMFSQCTCCGLCTPVPTHHVMHVCARANTHTHKRM